MARKRRKMKFPEAEVPLSAMIDVTFLLLIYFVVTQKPIIEETYLGVDLPAPGKPRAEKPPMLFTIDVNKQSNDPKKDLDIYYVNGRKWNFKDLVTEKIEYLEIGKIIS